MSQNFADKDVYLVDSLDLSKISEYDKVLVDSCIKIYHKSKDEETKFKAIDHLINECWGEDVWPKYNEWLHQESNKKLKGKLSAEHKKLFKSLLSTAYNNKGYLADQHGKSDWAIKYYNKSFEIDKELNDQKGMAQILNNIGGVYLKKGEIEEALAVFVESLNIRENENDSLGISQSLANIAAIYGNQGDAEKSLEYLFRCITYVKENSYARLGLIYNNIGNIYGERKETSKAFEYFNKSLEMHRIIGNVRGVSYALNNLGAIMKDSTIIECDLPKNECDKIRTEKALEYYLESLVGYEQVGDMDGASFTMNNIGSSYSKLGQLKLAEKYLKKSKEISESTGYPAPLRDAAVHLSDLYFKQGKNKESLEMYKLHIKMRDSLNNESTQKASIQQQSKYEYEKQKAVDDAKHDKEIAIEQEAKEKQTILTYATAGGLGLVAIFLLIVFNRLKVTRRQKNIIDEQKTEVEKQKAVVELAHTELEEKNREITDSIQYAKRIQNAILPPSKVVKEYLQESFIYYKPKDIVAGDFYWLEQTKDQILFAAADCTGHGVPGAMVSVVCNNGLNRSVREFGLTDPGEILNKTREIVVEEFEKSEEEVKDGMDIALCSLEGNKLQYAGAHNPLWIIRKDTEEIEEIKANKQPIGQFDNPEPYTTHTIELQKGDSLYIFSDGYADQFGGEKGKKLKTANFKKLLLSIQKESIEKQKQLIDEAFENWRGDLEQLDDVCVIGVKV